MSRSFNFTITQNKIQDDAQKTHNEIDENGIIDQERILEIISEEYMSRFYEWAEEAINWDLILENDQEAREYIEEKEEASKGQYA